MAEIFSQVMIWVLECCKDMSWTDVISFVSYYLQRMQFSEYPVEFRQQVLNEVLKKLDKKTNILQHVEIDDIPQNTQGVQSNQQWYMKDGRFESVMFVEATPRSELANFRGNKFLQELIFAGINFRDWHFQRFPRNKFSRISRFVDF